MYRLSAARLCTKALRYRRRQAGCAGFAAVLPRLLGLAGIPAEIPRLDPRLLVLCGSVNPITLRQLDKAEKAGFARMRLTPYQKLTPGYWESQHGREALSKIEKMLASNGHCIIETNDAGSNQLTADYAAALGIDRKTIRVRISGSVGHLLGAIFTSRCVKWNRAWFWHALLTMDAPAMSLQSRVGSDRMIC